MFTGIIKAKGTISAMEKRGGDVRMSVTSADLDWRDFDIGESIAVSGVCLTAVALRDDGFDTDVSVETLDVTSDEQVAELARSYADQPIDVLLNNAAIYGDLQKQTRLGLCRRRQPYHQRGIGQQLRLQYHSTYRRRYNHWRVCGRYRREYRS